jgi:tetratricopeptide (TPR) repeat protein
MADHPNADHFRKEEMMRTFGFSAFLIFSFFSAFLFGQIADTDSSAQPENENATTLTGPLNTNRSALPQSAGEVRQHLSDPLRQPNRATVDVDALALPSLPSDPKWSGDPRFTVSVSSLATPEKARKAFNKGEQEAHKGKLEAAYDHFKEAVATYPRYALAWLELGRLQAKQSSFAEAQESFRQAVTSDSSLTTGYVDFALVAARQQNWQAVAEMTDTLVQRFPDSSPVYWYLNSAAYYNLGKTKEAEGSITRALRLDPQRQLPQMEYLYGLILGNKKDYKSATEHISAYLRLAPNSKDSLPARQVLATYQQRAEMADDEQH